MLDNGRRHSAKRNGGSLVGGIEAPAHRLTLELLGNNCNPPGPPRAPSNRGGKDLGGPSSAAG
eukprot:9240166-Lingulodinium_polyedra.AAC.1